MVYFLAKIVDRLGRETAATPMNSGRMNREGFALNGKSRRKAFLRASTGYEIASATLEKKSHPILLILKKSNSRTNIFEYLHDYL